MTRISALLVVGLFSLSVPAWGDEQPQPSKADVVKAEPEKAAEAKPTAAAAEKPKYPPVADVLKDAKAIDGLLKLHQGDMSLFAELKPGDLNRDFIVLITIARGIGQEPLYGGFSWGFGDDWVWQFRQAGERVLVIRRNVRFKAEKNSPTDRAVQLAYTDSVLYSLPILTKTADGSLVVDLQGVFMSDLPQISLALPGYGFARDKSTWADVKGFPKNVEVQVAATYASGNPGDALETVPDARGVTVNVHYSISHLPTTDYKPRLADDRVGFFVTAVKDFSGPIDEDRFVRYINRWNLVKADPDAAVSTPKEPIVFWLEKTIPFKYRKPIRDGIAEWNKAFEKAGFYDAIDVRQQADDATWEPGDINYNSFRWITSGAGFAMGPSRVNPLTGQILDADIIFDADFLQYWKQEYEYFTPKGIELLTGGPLTLEGYHAEQRRLGARSLMGHSGRCGCNLLGGVSHQLAAAAAVEATRKRTPEELEKLIMQALKEVTMHEVGHTLGLRHNFKASTLYSVDELNDVAKTSQTGLTSSVMDYAPVNIVPKGKTQGDFYSTTIGPYDYWAIEYGYTPVKGDEAEALKKIASRSGEPALAYSTDEDTRGIDPDPYSLRFDMSNNLVEFAEQQALLVREVLPTIVQDLVEQGEGYERARRAFGVLLSREAQALFAMSRYVGGVHVSRSHKGDANATKPFEVVTADRQRETLTTLEKLVFGEDPFGVPRDLYNELAPARWMHWGVTNVDRPDYPVHDVLLMWQRRILDQLLSPLTLARLHDAELKVSADNDAMTVAELLSRLTGSIFSEVDSLKAGEYTNRKPAIGSLRRNLQRSYLRSLTELAVSGAGAPEDCRTLAFAELTDLKTKIDAKLAADIKLDRYTEAHLLETSARIKNALDAQFSASP